MDELLRRLQDYYGLDDSGLSARLAEPSLADLPEPQSLDCGFGSFIDELRAQLAAGTKIAVYGDYDVDGLTSTAILVGTLRRIGFEVGYYIPSRYLDGYGLSSARVRQFAEKGYRAVIAVDNGISEHEAVQLAKDLGLKVFIVDHHEVTKADLPAADYIFHQRLCRLTEYNISAAFLALLVSKALLGVYDPYFVTLAGLAVFSDSMPMIGANLVLARLALKNLNEERYPALCAFIESRHIGADDCSFSLIPALNSVGRVDQTLFANQIVKLLLSDDPVEISRLSARIKAANEERKRLVRTFETAAIVSDDPIVFAHVDLPLGLVGLLANKVMGETGKPAVLFTTDPADPTLCVGSVRTPSGYETAGVLQRFCPFLVRFGGHASAAGFTVRRDDLKLFQNALNDNLKPGLGETVKTPALAVTFKEIPAAYRAQEKLGPFGPEFEKPLFALTLSGSDLKFSRDGRHLITGSGNVKVVMFNAGREKFPATASYEFTGTLGTGEFNGRTTVDFRAQSVRTLQES